jgi:GNAT superfamily N-acetyltransferase
MEMKRATKDDLPLVAECHVLAFPDTLSAQLGVKFVAKSLECFVTDDNKFLLYIPEGGVCAGYVNGILTYETTMGSASSMMQSGFNEGVKALLTHPRLWLHPELRAKLPLVWRNVVHRYFGDRKANHKGAAPRPAGYRSVGLPGMCVHPNHRRKGYATKLMLAAEKVAYERGFRHMHCTVATTNTATTDCHTKLGYKVTQTQPTSVTMEKDLTY